MSEEATSSSQRQSEFTTSVAEIRAALEARLKELEKSIEAVDETATDARTLAFSGAEKNATNIEADVRPQSGAEASRAFRVVHRGCDDGTDYSNHVGVIEGQVFLDDVLVSEDSTAAFDFYDNSFEVTEETYGWIDLNMEDSEDLKWTMNVGATIPAADADHKIRALFHLPWDSTNSTIDAASVIRYHQGNVHFEAGGGGIDIDGAADGDIIAWDQTTDEAWEVHSMSGVADKDQMQWNNSGKVWEKCSGPHDPSSFDTVGSAAEGSEAAETTTKTFDGTKGLKFNTFTRVGYFEAGDTALYGYVRELRFDRMGRLYYVSGETRVEIDATVLET